MGLPLPDDARVTLTVAQLRALVEGRDRETFDPIGTNEAAQITGEHPRTLRRLWKQWDRQQADGQRPAVRVSRKSGSSHSDLLFDRSDCYAYRDAHGEPDPEEVRRAPADDGGEEDGGEIDAIAEHLASQAAKNASS